MSQAKVEQYKKDKANRKKIMRQEKIKKICGQVVAVIVVVAVLGWAGVSGYNYFESKKPAETYYTDLSAITDYMGTLTEE